MERNRLLGWTTLEEAKKLVEVGLDPNTADMCYLSYKDFDDEDFRVYGVNARAYKEMKRETKEFDFVPCWSLGALFMLIPKTIKVNDENFHFYMSYDNTNRWSAAYESVAFRRTLFCSSFPNQIELLVNVIKFFLRNNHIKKHE